MPTLEHAAEMSETFRRHLLGAIAFRQSIDMLRAQGAADPAFGFAPGTIQHVAALYQLLDDKLALLEVCASTPLDRSTLESFTEWRSEVAATTDALAYALDFSGR